MTAVLKSFENKTNYIELSFQVYYTNNLPHNVYVVRHYIKYGDLIGYPNKEMFYGDLKKATATYNRYKRGCK